MKAKKKSFDYFECLVKMANYSLEEAKVLKNLFENFNYEEIGNKLKEMHNLEHACDLEKHAMTESLIKDFLPPIDREDLFSLAHVCDDFTDKIESVLMFIYMADIKSLRSDANDFASLIVQCAENVKELMEEFKNFKKPEKLKDIIIKINDLEEEGDKIYLSAVKELSSKSKDLREIIEWRDTYRTFEHCFDAAENISERIEAIVMKNS